MTNCIKIIGNVLTENQKTHSTTQILSIDGICKTILSTCYKQPPRIVIEKIKMEYAIRKLTPKECWRLFGFDDFDFYKAKTGNNDLAEKLVLKDDLEGTKEADDWYKGNRSTALSDSQLYKQAGNSIVVDCILNGILKPLYESNPQLFENLKIGSYFSGIGAFEKALTRLFDERKN